MKNPDFWHKRSWKGHFLAPLGWVYGWISALRHFVTTPKKLSVPVICVGNLVLGGAGKTPTVMALVQILKDMGQTPHILTRGYGRKRQDLLRVDPKKHSWEDVGDEPLLLADIAPTWVCSDRFLSGNAAIQEGATVLVMDDGFQNPKIHKNFSFLVINDMMGLGNGYVFPAGPLREFPKNAYIRANAVVNIGGNQSHPILPTFLAHLNPLASTKLPSKALAFAGIGYPEKFKKTLELLGVQVDAFFSFPDHHPFQTKELDAMLSLNLPILTTTKDWVRLLPAYRDKIIPVPVTLEFSDTKKLTTLIKNLLGLK